MHEPRRNLETRVLSLLQVHSINDSHAAFASTIQALATISKTLDGRGIGSVISSKGFSHIRSLEGLAGEDLESLNKLVKANQESISESEINDNQIRVQKLISSPMRKRLAAYYTKTNGLELMAESARDFAGTRGTPVTLADPFLGSGLTLTETLKLIGSSKVRSVWGMEPHPLPALVAYSAVLYYLRGEQNKVDIRVGDVFRETHRIIQNPPKTSTLGNKDRTWMTTDVIVTNPPFTRWELLGDHYRNFLWKCVEDLGYRRYVTRRQLNLQVASLFLIDHLLNANGLLATVLPASTFYTLYGEAARSMLSEKYQINALIENISDKSFSIDSGLKEVILLATKGTPIPEKKTAFATLQPKDVRHIRQIAEASYQSASKNDGITWVDLKEKSVLGQTNWSIFFADAKLRETMSEILSRAMKNGTIGVWESIYGGQSIVRGVEMYGPDFFFIPNRYWYTAEEDSLYVTIKNFEDESRLTLLKDYLTPALRKPSLYLDAIIPSVKHYLISVPPEPVKEFQDDLASYIYWGERRSTGQPAIRLYGEFWYSHVNQQLRTKKPFGRVFLPDKVDPTFRNRGLFASHYGTPLTASKNFHVVSLNDDSKARLLTAWFNSTLFISYFILTGRKITRSWSRMLEDNYLKMPIINLDSLTKRETAALENALENILKIKLPPMKQQLAAAYRRQIDKTLLEIMGVEEQEEALRKMYSALEPNLS
jgi:type I restriction-modification system DNA methylase subunit